MTDCSTCSITITTSVGNVTYCEGNIIILKNGENYHRYTNFDMFFSSMGKKIIFQSWILFVKTDLK